MVLCINGPCEIDTEWGKIEVSINGCSLRMVNWIKNLYEDMETFTNVNTITLPLYIFQTLKSNFFNFEPPHTLWYLPDTFGDRIQFVKTRDFIILDNYHIRIGLKCPLTTKSYIVFKSYIKLNNEWTIQSVFPLDAIQLFLVRRYLRITTGDVY